MVSLPHGPEPCASANSAISANKMYLTVFCYKCQHHFSNNLKNNPKSPGIKNVGKNKSGNLMITASDCRQNAFGQHSRSVFLVFGSKSVYLINNKHFWAPLFPFLAIIFASFFRFMQANVSPTFISIRAFPIICV